MSLHSQVHQANSRARKYEGRGEFTLQEWKDLLTKCGNKCVTCGADENITVDHIVPLSLGGNNMINNIQPLCSACNSKKSNVLRDDDGNLVRTAKQQASRNGGRKPMPPEQKKRQVNLYLNDEEELYLRKFLQEMRGEI